MNTACSFQLDDGVRIKPFKATVDNLHFAVMPQDNGKGISLMVDANELLQLFGLPQGQSEWFRVGKLTGNLEFVTTYLKTHPKGLMVGEIFNGSWNWNGREVKV